MYPTSLPCALPIAGVQIAWPLTSTPPDTALSECLHALGIAELLPHAEGRFLNASSTPVFQLALRQSSFDRLTPAFDTLQMGPRLDLVAPARPKAQDQDLVWEIVLAMLASPVPHYFPSLQEFLSAVRIKTNIVRAAQKTMLTFETAAAERPERWWTYDEDYGYVIRPGASLITALIQATQPVESGGVYSFSCYRASEYVMLLGLAQELENANAPLYDALEALWRKRPIKSGEFHDVFLREQGSMEAPIPPHYFVPGDRVWFRNPDAESAEASGFEGSWVVYMGGGLFSNFWNNLEPYTLDAKFLEIYHWRHGLYRDANGNERIDEARVARLIQATREDPPEMERILKCMQRYREARGIYTSAGGCMDTTREFAKWVCPGTSDLTLPQA